MTESVHNGPLLLLADPANRAAAERIRDGIQGSALESVAEDRLGQVLLDLQRSGRPCVFVGELEPLVLGLASAEVARLAPSEVVPVIALTRGCSVIPVLGVGRGAEVLASRVSSLLAAIGLPGSGAPAGGSRGRVAVVGLGPGCAELMAPAVRAELDRAQDIVGYTTYVNMAGPFRADQRTLDSDNRCEMDRARLAFELAAQGRQVVVVSSGDPGIFAMATAVVEALEQAKDPAWHQVDLAILPGISAAQLAAARVGAPLGHDFCTISLSDNLKPWSLVRRRLELAARADLVIALYNPSSKARPWQLGEALELLRRHRAGNTPVVLGRDVGRPAECVLATTLDEVRPEQVDMRTVVILGSSLTRQFPRLAGGAWVYTPRWYPHSTTTAEGLSSDRQAGTQAGTGSSRGAL